MKTVQASDALRRAVESAANQFADEEEQRLCKAYYNGHQETPELKAYRDSMGQPVHPPNLYKKMIDTVLGMEEQGRTDLMMVADDEDSEEVAEAVNQEMNEVLRLHDVNHHCSEAYKPMIIAGLGWLYIGKNTDPLGLEYDVHTVASSEIIWDRRCTRLDMEDCQYLFRRKFLDHEQAKAFFPDSAKLIDTLFHEGGEWGPIPGGERSDMSEVHTGVDCSTYMNQLYRDSDRPTVAVFDGYYRSYEERPIIFMPNGQVMEYNENNPQHVDMNLDGTAEVIDKRVSVMRNAWYIGPYLISDEVSPHPHRMFPYLIDRGHQEEDTNVVFGVGRQMIAPQDAFNGAHVQQHALLEKVTVLIKKGALAGTAQTNEDVQMEAHKADGIIEVSDIDRDVKIVHHYEQIQHLEEMKRGAKDDMRESSGVSNVLSGQEESTMSGVARQSGVDQATSTLAEINSNHQVFRRLVGRIFLAHIMKKRGSVQYEVPVKAEHGKVAKVIKINRPAEDGAISNSLVMARMQVAVADINTSAGYRAQNMLMLQNTAPSAPEALQMHMHLAMLELSNLPNKQELVQAAQKMIGKAETEDEQEKMDADAAQAQQDEMDLIKREREADIEVKAAQAAKYRAEAANVGQEDGQVAVKNQQAANDQQVKERDEKVAILAQARERLAERSIA